MIPLMFVLLIVICTFLPPSLRGIAIALISCGGLMYCWAFYRPRTELPELPPTPAEEAGEDLLQQHWVEKSLDQTDPLRKVVVEAVHAEKK